jgi:DNA-binding CsgD family transcriptional regulator
MTALVPATVVFGDVVGSRSDPGTTAFLRGLRDELEAAYGSQRLAPSGFTQGDELQLLLAPGADPFDAILRAALRADARGIRWAIVGGQVLSGTGPATERTGPAFHAARELLERAKARRVGLLATTGDAAADTLLDELGPVLASLLEELTERQREVARLILVDDVRRAEAAERLGVSRATVSVIAARARVRHLAALASALGRTFREGAERAAATPGAGLPTAVPAGAA